MQLAATFDPHFPCYYSIARDDSDVDCLDNLTTSPRPSDTEGSLSVDLLSQLSGIMLSPLM